MSLSNLRDCCDYIASDKVSDRKKYCTQLNSLLEDQNIINLITVGKIVSWKNLINSLQTCLKKDAEKVIEDAKKKCVPNVSVAHANSELFVQVIEQSVKEDGDINILELVGYILGCLNESKMQKLYQNPFLRILNKSILSNSKNRSQLEPGDWEALYNMLKKLLDKCTEDNLVYNCFMNLIKYGPKYGLSPLLLRQEFEFFTNICQRVNRTSPRQLQEHILEIAIDFCRHTVKDNRISCCKFGEDVFVNLASLYELNGKPERKKEILIDFCLLQIIIHHPNGVVQGDAAAYAYNWNQWKKLLKTTYNIISKEIDLYFKHSQKNTSFFKIEGDKTHLCPKLTRLFVEISKQIFVYPDLDVSMAADLMNISQKRQRTEFKLSSLIDTVRETKSWLWINLVTAIIKTYPKIIEIDDFTSLLDILYSIQIESNEYNVIEKIYNCLYTLILMQNALDMSTHEEEINKLWKLIGENTTRAFGLNQHKDVTEKLLEELIDRKMINFEDILQIYQSGLISLSTQSIRTFSTSLQYIDLNDINKKKLIANCVLNFQNLREYKYLCNRETATFLVKLTLKQWQKNEQNDEVADKDLTVCDDLNQLYLKILLDIEVCTPKVIEAIQEVKNSPDIDFEFAATLKEAIKDFVANGDETEEILLSKTVLVANISSHLTEYQVMPEEECKRFLTTLLQFIFNKTVIIDFSLSQLKNDRDAMRLINCFNILKNLFSLKVSNWVMTIIKQLFPTDLLKKFFDILHNHSKEKGQISSVQIKLKISLMEALSSFGCICGDTINQTQKQVLEVLTESNYDFTKEDDFIKFSSFLNTLKLAKAGSLPNSVIQDTLECTKELCAERYKDKTEEILYMLCGLYPHLADLKFRFMEFLRPFYFIFKNYGSSVAIALLKCFQIVYESDSCDLSMESSIEILKYIPEFLKSNYVEVRFKAIDVLVMYYKRSACSNNIEDIHRQEELFSKIYDMSIEVFNVSDINTNERRSDEVISRTASVLLVFGNIAINCDDWIEESIYSLIKIAYIKNIANLDKIFKILSKQTLGDGKDNILDKYILYLVEKWLSDNYKFDNFPYGLLNCSTKLEFYKRYFDECAPIFIMSEGGISAIARYLQVTENDIVQEVAAKIFARIICTDMDSMTDDILTQNKMLSECSNSVGVAPLKTILENHLDQIILGILDYLTDEQDIKACFGESVIFFSNHLNRDDVKRCITFVESFICNYQPIAQLLTDNQLPKFENILLMLKCNIYKSIAVKEKLKYFHRYVVFVSIITGILAADSSWRYFFVRDVMYTLVNIIENSHCNKMITASCKFLNTFLRRLLPEFATTFKDFFRDTVNSLRKFYVTKKCISKTCKTLLDFLIVENTAVFKDEIKILDTFPDKSDFNEIRAVLKAIRYGNRDALLEDEIIQFLNHKDVLTKEDSLVHLRTVLAKEKDKLAQLYEKLQNIRGFSEDCENSLLHRLVCVLAQLCCSTNQKVSLEAARCLGEMGPANLQTTVLQLEKKSNPTGHTCYEILTGNAISLLIKYIIDCDIHVIKAASKVLFLILDSKEGRKVVDLKSDFGYGPVNKKYIIPYFPSRASSSPQSPTLNIQLFISTFKNGDLWCPKENTNHNSWITSLVTNILGTFDENKSFLTELIQMCNIKVEFSECLLPLIIDLLVSFGNTKVIALLFNKIEGFFSMHWDLTVQRRCNEESVVLNKKSVKCMLNVVDYVRLMIRQRSLRQRLPVELNINFLKVAKAAEFCSNHFLTLYYSELWCQQIINQIQTNSDYCEQRSTMLDHIYEREDPVVSETLHNMLKNAYKAIGDFDALPGCGLSFLLQPKHRVEYYKEQGKFDQVIQYYSTQSLKACLSSKELIDSFKSCNLYQIPLFCSRLEEPEYECMWRLGQWDFVEKRGIVTNSIASYEDIEKYRFYALKALHDNNQCVFEESSKCQFLCAVNHIKNISLESSHNLYPIFTQLQSLVEIKDFSDGSKSNDIAAVFKKWKLQDRLLKKNDFQYVEPIIAQRLIMLTDYLNRNENDNVVRDYMIDLSFDFANWAKDESHFKESLHILENMKKITSIDIDVMTKIDLLDAQLSWSVGNSLVAKQILNRLSKNDINPKLKAAVMKLTGHYATETHSENRTTISQYFLESISLMGSVERDQQDKKNIMDTYDKLALFADREYVLIKTYMKSDLFQKKIANMKQAKKNASSIQKQRKKTYEENKAAVIYTKNCDIDEEEIKGTKTESNTFLHLALKYYLLCLIHSEDRDIRIFRIISLFLENRKNNDITKTIQEYLPKLPSHKYILVLPQLIPHLSLETDRDLFNRKVNEIVEQCAQDHPHHTLPLLLSLANAYKDRDFEESATKTSTNDARISTATSIITRLSNDGLSSQIKKLNNVCTALIHLAYFKGRDEGNEKKKEFTIPKDQKIIQIKDFDDVLVPTYTLPISVTKNYSNIVGISSFKSTYQIVGGVNKPKKILCRGTDGKYHSQLVKGQDDLRQDAVMQQVFSIMNSLLSYNKATQHLLIRTYKIVPLSMRSGILKWADNSMPIGEYLTGGSDSSKGAHQRYRPSDKLPSSCREYFKKCAGKSADIKLKIYKDICATFKPVFHHFFEEYFLQPAVWYERRRAFIHSVATTSMCGYILGIGDRHTSNILIDNNTAEVIHIDFGIAFEQGRVLPTPETVPFRLTRDMVDAMGSSGVEGIFRRSCEKTMEVLRQNAQTIITILEVLLYDPLYAWTVTSAEANKRQTDSDNSVRAESSDSSEEPTNISAERALLRLREKLQGTELGNPRSIEHQVGTLIQQAVDPANLCKLFVGWQPYV